MKLEIRTATNPEHMYMYAQSMQLESQTGQIGYLRADMDTDGNGFFSTWNDTRANLKTQEFKAEFDEVIHSLRANGGILKNRTFLSRYCFSHMDADIGTGREFGFRTDTESYAYLLRLNPNRGEYNLYCYCYRRDWLDRHLSNAARGIRFIMPNYRELFCIDDGDMIRITTKGGEFRDRTARYIDDYHVELHGPNGDNLYHICELAEQMEQAGCQGIIPLRKSLPEQCYSVLEETGEIILLKKGESGFYKTDIFTSSKEESESIAEEQNRKLGASKAQAEAMKAGSLFGWAIPAADPKNYDENGIPLRSKYSNMEVMR